MRGHHRAGKREARNALCMLREEVATAEHDALLGRRAHITRARTCHARAIYDHGMCLRNTTPDLKHDDAVRTKQN